MTWKKTKAGIQTNEEKNSERDVERSKTGASDKDQA